MTPGCDAPYVVKKTIDSKSKKTDKAKSLLRVTCCRALGFFSHMIYMLPS